MRKNNIELEDRSERTNVIGFIIRFVWIFALAAISWRIANWLLFDAQLLSMNALYNGGMPREWPEGIITLVIAGVVFIFINLLVWIGYFVAVPSGRRRPNRASTYSRNPEIYRS